MPEQRKTVAGVAQQEINEPELLRRYSSLTKLLRVTAWCRRWPRVRQRKHRDEAAPTNYLSAHELDEAQTAWLLQIQAIYYKAELATLNKRDNLKEKGALAKLSPFIDAHGLLRVGGRLKHSLLSFDEKHPLILPAQSHLTKLIVDSCHRRTMHGGVQQTLGLIRRQFWIPRGRAAVKQHIHNCVTCVRWRAATPNQLMANLPRQRVTPARPFQHSGVDYAGPIMLRTAPGRGHKAHKAFVVVFICLSTKAVHLDVASNYSTDAFLAAFRRFTARRGLCQAVYSDCGTNFIGADSQLRSMFVAGSKEAQSIAHQLSAERIQWHFNPPAAPHFGGVWEAAVKSLKHHMRRVIGEATLTYEEMVTLLTQVEACLNSRPLQALTDDPDDLAALTPGHFLIGSAINAVPEQAQLDTKVSPHSRWQLVQRMRDHFWERWSTEYLHSLLPRPKWQSNEQDVKIGRLCLILNESQPPTKWPLARIMKLHPGDDGKVRVVTIKTATSEFTRPIVKLVLLPCATAENASAIQP